MRIFLAGATGVIGTRILSRMIADGHHVAAMTRTADKLKTLEGDRVTPILCDVFDWNALVEVVTAFKPDLVIHQITDLPDEMAKIREFLAGNNRARSEGTQNLLRAAQIVGAGMIAQSIAWPGGAVVEAHEKLVLLAGGTVLRYGQFYGAGTYFETKTPPHPRVHIDEAAERTIRYLANPGGIVEIAEVKAA